MVHCVASGAGEEGCWVIDYWWAVFISNPKVQAALRYVGAAALVLFFFMAPRIIGALMERGIL